MDAVARPQDLPPSGGYKKIPFARIPAKTYFSGKYFLFFFLISSKKKKKKHNPTLLCNKFFFL